MTGIKSLIITRTARSFFGSGGLVYGVIENAIYFVLIYYSQVPGLSPELTGLALSEIGVEPTAVPLTLVAGL